MTNKIPIGEVYLDRAVCNHPNTIKILDKIKPTSTIIVEDPRQIKKPRNYEVSKKQLFLTYNRGISFRPCQGMGASHLCCNYRVINLISGCPLNCSYCILQSYLYNNPVITIYVNIETVMDEIAAFLANNPETNYRIGTGELSDSIALDDTTGFNSILIPFFASYKNVLFELKTKTSSIDHLLNLEHGGRTVLAWSVNTQHVIENEERGTAKLDARLSAAIRAANAGYKIAFHFDPIILDDGAGNMNDYLDVADQIFDVIDPSQIPWISLGLLRYPRGLETIATRRFPKTRIFTGEFVPIGGKMRYPRFMRAAAYRPLWERIKSKLPESKIYLCMETKTVWNEIDPSVTSNTCMEERLLRVR